MKHKNKMKNKKASGNLDNCKTDDTASAVKSLVGQLFDNITPEQWDEFLLGRPDKVTTKQLTTFVGNMVNLCPQSTAANQGSSQGTPALDVSSSTAGRKTVEPRKTACGSGFKKKLKNLWKCLGQSSSVSSADRVESAIENPIIVPSCAVPKDYAVHSVIDGVILQAEKAAHLPAETYKKQMFDKLWPEVESKDVEIAENVETVIFSDICKELAIPEHAVFAAMVLDQKHQETIVSTFKKHLVPSYENTSSSVKAETPAVEKTKNPQKSSVKHESSVLAENNSEDKIWLSTLIQTVLSQLTKISVSPSSDSLHERLLEKVWAEIQNIKVPLGPEVLEKVAKDIFSDLNEKVTALDETLIDTTVFLVFKQRLLALTDTCQVQSREKEEEYRLSVEICIEDVVRRVLGKEGVCIPLDRLEAIQNRFTTVVWAEIKEEYVKVPLENFKNLSKLVYKSLCKEWPEVILTVMQLQKPIVEETIVEVFKNHVAKLSKKPGWMRRFFSSARNLFLLEQKTK
ncbi:unnamed protein product [Oreochromis niloticus]|nr:unnamed protein product [Mustela putorius furo]